MRGKFYITTTLPYVNAEPHIGFGTEIIRADIIARFHELSGEEVFFNTGTDEHGQKIYCKALLAQMEPQVYCDLWAEKFKELKVPLGLREKINFIRTTDPHHVEAVKEFWRRSREAGDIYKKIYQGKYCVGCEMDKLDSELVNGRCPEHPNMELETREEENYFFRFSKYQDALLKLYDERTDFIIPPSRQKEIKAFVSHGLNDFSISRLASKMPWGIPVPDDPDHVMYVWFDALVNYISVLGWPEDERRFFGWWAETGGAVQYCGKDNLRHQSAMWQAMLMSVGLPPSKHIIVEGFISNNGQKMSKSLGNVVNPIEVAKEFGTDALRYHIAREFSDFEDSDFTWEKFKEAYNANLANGLGNLTSRVMKMAEDNLNGAITPISPVLPEEYVNYLKSFNINKAADFIWGRIKDLDGRIQFEQPFKIVKTDQARGKEVISGLVVELALIAEMLLPIMPKTAGKIKELIMANKAPDSPLFIRK